MDLLMLLAGLVLLFLSGKWLVNSSVAIAKRFQISTLVIGITVVAFGTSAPELFVSLKAVFGGSPDISVGNVVGSNIANIALVLGLVAIIIPIGVKKRGIVFDWLVMMLASILFLLLGLDGVLSFWEGVLFCVLLSVYLIWSVYYSRKKQQAEEVVSENEKTNIGLTFGLLLVSVIGLYFGAEWLVQGARNIALGLGVSERVVGISVVAFGTSVPELATSIMALMKKENDISIGNIIGSNIFNVLAILGVTSILKDINVSQQLVGVDGLLMLGISLLLFLFILPLGRGEVTRIKGAVLLSIYIVYMLMVFNVFC